MRSTETYKSHNEAEHNKNEKSWEVEQCLQTTGVAWDWKGPGEMRKELESPELNITSRVNNILTFLS